MPRVDLQPPPAPTGGQSLPARARQASSQIAVFDTRVRRPDGRTMHFDILVRDQDADKAPGLVLSHGRRYLAAKGVPVDTLSARECRFCHTESAPPSIEAEIERIGFAIIELQNCD